MKWKTAKASRCSSSRAATRARRRSPASSPAPTGWPSTARPAHPLPARRPPRRARSSADGKFDEPSSDKYKGKRLNSPNDLVFTRTATSTSPTRRTACRSAGDDPEKELDFQGVYRLTPNGKLTLLTKEMTRRTASALSPDEKTLYVANSDPEKAIWMAFPVKADGTLGEGKVFHDATAA